MDANKVLEAEESIVQIAKELERMRKAAALLQANENSATEVIRAADAVLTATREFTEKCGGVVNRLAETDLHGRLDSILGVMKSTEKSIAVIPGVHQRLDEMSRELREFSSKTSSVVQSTKEAQENSVKTIREQIGRIGNAFAQVQAELKDLKEAQISFREETAARTKPILYALVGVGLLQLVGLLFLAFLVLSGWRPL